jgi:CBS domain-containing protein
MRVEDVMTTEVVTVTADQPLKDAARVLSCSRVSGLPVVDAERRVVGVLSEADLLRKEGGTTRGSMLRWLFDPSADAVRAKLAATTVGEAMTTPALTTTPDRPLHEVATRMLEHGVNRLPVVGDDGKLVGIISRADLVRAFTRSDEEIEREVREDVVRRVFWLDPTEVGIDVREGVVTLNGELESEADVEALPRYVARVPGVVTVRSRLRARDHALSR